MPQWQGGDEPAYRFGSELLRWLAPPHDGPEESVEVPEADSNPPPVDHGIKWRDALLSQATAEREALARHAPVRIVPPGDDSQVALAPMTYATRVTVAKLRGIL